MKLISWNVNGLRAIVKKNFHQVLAELQPDIMLLQEIKIDDAARARHDFAWPDYYEYFFPAARKGYSGTALLSKQELKVTSGLGVSKFDGEGRVQTAELKDFYVVNAYFPNTQAELARLAFKQEFNREILSYLKKLEKNKPVIIGGDFNVAREAIDIARPKDNERNAGFTPEERSDARAMLAAGFVDTFRYLYPNQVRYSWWTYRFGARARNVGWRIDYFLTSSTLAKKIKQAYILDQIMGSDHAPIGLEI